MLQIQQNVDLTPYNTFKVSAKADAFCVVKKPNDLSLLASRDHLSRSWMSLGEGANILFTKDFDSLVVKNEILGREVIHEDDKSITLKVGAGEDWHELVMWSVENSLSGIENLALIPGTVGAAAVGNIAAYGQNFGEVVEAVEGFYLRDLRNLSDLSKAECHFFYRDSVFKNALKGKFIITSVTIKLSKSPKFDTNYHGRASYESLAGELKKFSSPPYSPKDVAEAVIRIRKIKMPDWHELGTAGSFFKNPFVSKEKFAKLKEQMPDIQAYPINHMLYPNPDDPVFSLHDQVKIPVGRLLDELGWKGKRIGNVGTFEKHALIIVNYGGATGMEILDFSQKMQEEIKQNFEIILEPEVNII